MGYIGKIGIDIDYKNATSTDAYNSGFWAYKDKKIEYALPLKAGNYNLFAGFNEWWNAYRTIGICISYKNADGQIIKQDLGTFTNSGKKTVDYKFELLVDAEVTISVYKPNANNPDVILSWFGIAEIK